MPTDALYFAILFLPSVFPVRSLIVFLLLLLLLLLLLKDLRYRTSNRIYRYFLWCFWLCGKADSRKGLFNPQEELEIGGNNAYFR